MNREKKQLIQKLLVDQSVKAIDLPTDQRISLQDVISPNFLENTIYSMAQKFTIPANYNAISIPSVSADSGLCGGLTFYLVDSGESIGLTKTNIYALRLELSKLGCVIPLTGELSEDTAPYLTPFIQTNVTKSLRYALDILMLYGDPDITKFTGVLYTGAPSTKWIDTAVYTTTATQLRAMVDSYYGGADGKFYVSRTVYNDLIDLVDTADTRAITVWNGKLYIYNYLVEVSNVMEADQILLGDFTQYAVAQKDLRKSISESLYFLTDQQAMKYVFRAGGNSLWDDALTQEDNVDVYPFVALDSMKTSSSSSSG